MKREVPMVITAFCAVLMLLDYFVPGLDLFSTWAEELTNWGIIVSGFAMGIGAANLLRTHSMQIARGQEGWINSVLLLAGMIAFFGFRVFTGNDGAGYQLMFDGFYSPMGAAMFSILAFYIASASYRAFRFRSLEATILLITGLLVMFGNAPAGQALLPASTEVSSWVMKVANVAGQRGILIGAAIGAIATSLRVLMGLERGHLGGGE